MKHDESIDSLLEADLASTKQSMANPATFEDKVFQKVQGRRRRRYVGAAVGSLCTVFALSLGLNLTPVFDSGEHPTKPTTMTASKATTPSTVLNDNDEVAYWQDDPFDNWSDEMPEDYELVIDL